MDASQIFVAALVAGAVLFVVMINVRTTQEQRRQEIRRKEESDRRKREQEEHTARHLASEAQRKKEGERILASILQEWQGTNDPQKKCELIKTLAKHRGDGGFEAIVWALKDQDEKVRMFAVAALQDLGDARAVQPLIEVLMTDKAPQPCYYATKALARFKTPRAIAGMVSALENQKGDLSELAFQLGEMRAGEAVDALCRLAEGSGDAYARRHAVMSLGNIGDRRAIPALRKALSDNDDGVRERAQSSLTRFG